jgi:DNA-binding NarL/FixJ family response regulator
LFSIAIVDDQPIRRSGMERLVADDQELTIVASVDSVDGLEDGGAGIDVVVLDLPRPAAGLAVIARIAAVSRLLVVSTWEPQRALLSAVRAGASACISRHSDPNHVATALTVVRQGGFYVCDRLRPQLRAELTGPPRDEPASLGPREVETLCWIARGFTQAQIATRMGLTEATINTYAKRIRAKLHASNKAELTRKAIQLGHVPYAHPAV